MNAPRFNKSRVEASSTVTEEMQREPVPLLEMVAEATLTEAAVDTGAVFLAASTVIVTPTIPASPTPPASIQCAPDA